MYEGLISQTTKSNAMNAEKAKRPMSAKNQAKKPTEAKIVNRTTV